MKTQIDIKRIGIFVAFAYGIAWATALVIYATGGFENSPMLVPAMNLSLGIVLTAVVYMGAPALAHVLTRVVTREGWQNTGLRPRFRQGWPYWLAAWFLPGLLTILGGLLYYLLFPGRFSDAALNSLRDMGLPNPWLIVAAQTFGTMLFVPLINGLFTFGEEFGWRAYLLPRLLPLGARKAVLVSGLIWGAWHWPVTLMGHNYGLDYPGYPWLGMLAMLWMTLNLGVFLSWVTIRGRSVWPAVIGHAAINGIGALPVIFHAEGANMVLGPAVAGVIGSAGFFVMAVILLAGKHLEPAPEE